MRISDWSSDVCSSDLPGSAQVDKPIAGEPHAVGAIVEAGAGAAHRDRNIGAFERALRRPRQFGVDHMPRPPREAIALQRRSGSAILDRQPAVIAAERETLVQLHATLDLDPLGAGA